jgi:hypothetical protein
MSSSVKKLLRIVAKVAVVGYAVSKTLAILNHEGKLTRLFDDTCEKLDRRVGWDRLPTLLSTLTLVGLRHILRRDNLYDTASPGVPEPPPPPPPHPRHLTVRTVDGTYNDLNIRAWAARTRASGVTLPSKKPIPTHTRRS